jgi:hypothetical protein
MASVFDPFFVGLKVGDARFDLDDLNFSGWADGDKVGASSGAEGNFSSSAKSQRAQQANCAPSNGLGLLSAVWSGRDGCLAQGNPSTTSSPKFF